MRVVLHIPAALDDICVRRAIGQRRARAVLDHVGRSDELAVGEALALVGAAAGACLASVLPACFGVVVAAGAAPVAGAEVAGVGAPGERCGGRRALRWFCAFRGKVGLQTGGEAWDRRVGSISDGRRSRRVAVYLGEVFRCGVVTRVRTVIEVCRLVHVDPQGVDIRAVLAVEEVQELLCPVLLRRRVEPVREVTGPGPDYALVDGALVVSHEGVVLETRFKSRVGFLVEHSRVDHDDVVLVSGVDGVHQVFIQISWVPLRIDGEDAAAVHVVDVRPDRFEGDVVGGVVGDDSSNLVDIPVAVFALVVSKPPVGRHQRGLRDFCILDSDIARGRTGNEVEVEDAADDVVLEVLAALVVDVDVHSIRVEEEHSVRAVLPVVKVDRMSTVQVLALWCPVGIPGVDCAGVVGRVEHERVAVLAQAVQMRVLGQMCLEIDILALKDELGAGGVEEDFPGVCARDGERERVGLEVELELAVLWRAPLPEARAREHTIGHLVDGVVGVEDLDVQAVVGLILDLQLQVRQVSPVDIACLPGERQVRVEARPGVPVVGGLVSRTLREVLDVEVVARRVEGVDPGLTLRKDRAAEGCGRREQLREIHACLGKSCATGFIHAYIVFHVGASDRLPLRRMQ